MSSSLLHGRLRLLLLPCLLLLVPHHQGSHAADLIYNICGDGNYTASGTFQANLGMLLSSLSSAAPSTGYFNDTAGHAPDQVYGLAMCRGDTTAVQCRECLAGVAQDAARVCPRRKGATLWYDKCHLRYSNERFFGSSTGSQFYMWNVNNASDPATFDRLLGELMDGLAGRAARSPRMFTVGEVNFTSFSKIYGLVQCTRDLSAVDCDRCLRDEIGQVPRCCKDKEGGRVIGGSCYLRFESYPFYDASAAADDPPPPTTAAEPPLASTNRTSTTSPDAGKKDNTLRIALATAIPSIVSGAVITTICVCIRRKKREKKILDDRGGEEIGPVESLLFDLETLKLATENFSDSNKLGEGGFGAVYKGVLPSAQQIAVKRLSRNSGQGLGELRNEVDLVAKLQHRNLVRLLGCYIGQQEKLLVYEYLQNKSLDRFLFDPIRSMHLNWERRLKIIEGIARGLLYLHEDSRLKVIHRDLKASNILLDEEMNPKISDFGLARLFGNEQSEGNTSRVAGTYGYMAPEYVMHGSISTKSDVYSFGVLVLEIVTGLKCIGFRGSSHVVDLISYVWQHWSQGNALQLLDRRIMDNYSMDQVMRCLHIGLLCGQHDPQERPNMSLVALMLSSQSVTLPALSPSEYFTNVSTSSRVSVPVDDPVDDEHSKRTTSPHRQMSNATMSDITILEPR